MSTPAGQIRPLTERQFGRYSAVPISTILHVQRHAPDAVATYWVASARGDMLAPEGTRRQLNRFEGERSPGVLLTPAHRAQLAHLERLWSPRLDRAKPETDHRRSGARAYQRRLQQLAEAGVLHRCTRAALITLYFEPRQDGDECAWRDCPIGVFETASRPIRASRGGTSSVTRRRSQRHAVTLETGLQTDEVESTASPAGTAVARASRDDAEQRLQRRMEQGCTSSVAEKEAMERVKTILGAVEMHTTPTPDIETTLTDLVVAQFMASLQEEGVAA